jgi:putative transposase
MLLPKIIGRFKMKSAKESNTLRKSAGVSLWQRGYYEHIIRSDANLTRIRTHIANNPLQWAIDEENPAQTA